MKGCQVTPPGIRRAEVRENDECLVKMVWNKKKCWFVSVWEDVCFECEEVDWQIALLCICFKS